MNLDVVIIGGGPGGYEAATVAGVAERAGSSVGNVYKYFGSKDALVQEVLRVVSASR